MKIKDTLLKSWKIKQALKQEENISVGFFTSARFAINSGHPQYGKLVALIRDFSARNDVKGIVSAPFNKIFAVLDRVKSSDLEESLSGPCGDVLHLGKLIKLVEDRIAKEGKQKILSREEVRNVNGAAFLGRRENISDLAQIIKLLGFLGEEKSSFKKLSEDPAATEEKFFKCLEYGVEKFKELGFHATILVPLSRREKDPAERLWSQKYRAAEWAEGTYAVPKKPESTLLSILEKTNSCFFKTNLLDPKTFTCQGLEYNEEKLRDELANSKGSPETWIYKLVSQRGEVIAAIYLNNRVSNHLMYNPSQELFPETLASPIRQELDLYFLGTVIDAYNWIEYKKNESVRMRRDFLLSIREAAPMINDAQLFSEVKKHSTQMHFGGVEINFLEHPLEQLFQFQDEIVCVYRELIISIYQKSEDYKDLTRGEIIKALSLDNDEEVKRKTLRSRYLPFIMKAGKLLGIVSGNVCDHIPGVGTVFEIPVAMIEEGTGKRGLLTYITLEMVLTEFWAKWARIGFVWGFPRMLLDGIPLFAWTQSKRVAKSMSHLEGFWLPVKGRKVSPKIRRIVEYFSREHERPVDESLIARNVYEGRIAQKEKEKFQIKREGMVGWVYKLISWIFGSVTPEEIDKFFDELGEKDATPVVGYFTIGVAMKMRLFMAMMRFLKKK